MAPASSIPSKHTLRACVCYRDLLIYQGCNLILPTGFAQVRGQRDAIDEKTAKLGAEALVQQSLRKGTADNVTAVVLMMDWPEA